KDRSRSRTTRRWICKNRRQKPLWLLPSVLYLIICRGIGTEFVVVLDTGHGTSVHHVRIPLLIRLAEAERVRIARPAPRLIHGLINSTLHFLPVVFLGEIRKTRHDTRRTQQLSDFSHDRCVPPGKEKRESQTTLIHPNQL